ncbi:putative glycoprotein 3-alpha-L-fucosyltransferase A-like [Apostichopus japonicus]|uniref:Fucosyltransferase n=1 Tax=Stichopus japonicus TaxID=307972 RepID=A0A2G8KL19_STIJA|nr:putative glycoprotein 3-alpha-L-fucosyltransferase A-like [Apostichopus japonicus]
MGKIRYRYIIVVLCVVCFCRLTLKTYYTFVYGTESGVAGGGVPSRTNQKKILMHSENRPATKRDKCEKKILFWTKRKHTKFNRSRHVLCLKSSCNATIVIGMEWTDFLDSHAVIFDHKVVKNWKQLIRRRPRNQIWIFYTRESPVHLSERNNFPRGIHENVHNWTKVYLTGSDLPTIYGRFVRKSNVKDVKMNFRANKTKLCSWIASNCRYTSWNRSGFVKALQKYMPIDIYGKCGNGECPGDCLDILPQYKFYLALESNTCRDYITEKVWRNSFTSDVIPVVYGAPKADYERILPPNSFIHVEDFRSFRELARFLRQVGNDDEKYNSYFAWRRDGAIVRQTGSSVFSVESICDITQKLVSVEDGVEVKPAIQRNIKDWWEGSCFTVKKKMVYL